jgi:hypothetical protein
MKSHELSISGERVRRWGMGRGKVPLAERIIMTQYMLSVFDAERPDEIAADVLEKMNADIDTLNNEMIEAGAWVFAGGLHPVDTATVVREKNGETVTIDGPYAETKEQVGGFWVIEAPDLDAALKWAEKATRACQGPIEVRPFQDEPEV